MPDYENIAGSASAAALGFIHGNVKGAYIGYNLYQKYRNMTPMNYKKRFAIKYPTPKRQKLKSGQYGHPTPQSSGRSRLTSLNPNRKRRLSGTYGRSSSVSSSSKRARSVGTSRKTSGGNNNLNNSIKGRTKGRIATRHRKTVPVSKKLRAQIKTVTQDKGVQGKRVQLWNDYFTQGAAIPVSTRRFKFVHAQHTNLAQVFFTPLQIMDSASVLFNKKTIDLDYSIETGNFGVDGVEAQIDDMIFDITRQSAEYIFKNNSQRHYEFTITVCTPKENTDDVAQDTITDAITVDTVSGQWNGNPLFGPSKENAACVWQDSPTLKKYYKMEKTTIRMDPGANSSWTLHGFTGRFNMKKYIKQDQTSANTRWLYPKNETKFVVFDCIANLVSCTNVAASEANAAGRWLAVDGTVGAPILMECKTTIEMQAPGIKPVANQRNIRFFENWTQSIPIMNRTIGTRDMDDEGVVLYIPQNS